MKKQDYIDAATQAFAKATETCATIHANALEIAEKFKAEDVSDSAKEAKRALLSSVQRSNECATMSKFVHSDTVMTLCFVHKIDFDAILFEKNKNTREFKLRFIKTFKAIAEKNIEALKNDDARLYSALFSNRINRDLTKARIQSEMQHKTDTQARYFKDFLVSLNCATFVNDVLKIDRDNAIVKKIEALFA